MTTTHLTNSEINDFLRCPRMHYLGSVLELEPNTPPSPLRAAEIGTRVHKLLERYYRGESPADVLCDAQSEADAHEETTPGSDAHKAAQLVHDVFEGYLDYLSETGLDSGVEVIAAESTWTRTHPDFPDVVFQGKIDLETDEGPEDFKTCAVPMSQKEKEVQRSRQLLYYSWLMEPQRHVNRVRVRILRQSTRSERTTGPYYGTVDIPINAAQFRSLERHLREWVPQILANYDRASAPPPVPDSDCSWRCPFYQVCPMFDDGRDAQIVLDSEFHKGNKLARYTEE